MSQHILLMSLPFWPPQIPPVGISCLKSYLQARGYRVTTVDVNTDNEFRGNIYNRYFDTIKRHVPENKRGNLYGIGTDVLKNHFMAHINHNHPDQYLQLVKQLLYQTYYTSVDEAVVLELNGILTEYYRMLEGYILEVLSRLKTDVLGLSVNGGNLPSSLFCFRTAKKQNPRIKTVMGGGIFSDQLALGSPNLEFFLEKTKDYIDALVVGEGELLFHRYLQGHFPASQRLLTLKDIDGELLDLTQLGIPDFTDFDIRAYPFSSGYTSRSCPFQCGFCSETVLWGKYRKLPPEQAVMNLEELYRRDCTQLFSLSDSLLNPNIAALAQEFLKLETVLYWDVCLRVDDRVCNPDHTHLWRRAGLYKTWLGMESGSQRVLDLMNKRITTAQAGKALSSLADAGIKTATLWLIGFPGETEEDFQQTLDFIEQFKDDIYDAEGTPFWYYLSGQSNSLGWASRPSYLLYPQYARDMLILETRVLKGEPSREVTYQRLNRFIQHIKKLGIPNPYTLQDICNADQRWEQLHKNAVPPVVRFNESTYIDECRNIEKYHSIETYTGTLEEGDFAF